MWFLVIALASIVTSLIMGRLLARAVAEQTNPRLVRGPSLDDGIQADRLAISATVARLRVQPVHLN